jgi:HSP20 family protein
LLGINTAVVQNSQGIGFAIPVEKVKEVLRDFRENKGRAVDLKAIAASPGPLPQNTVTINNTIDYAGPQFIKEETKDAYLVKMDIQGLDRAKLNVGVNPNFIRISGARTVQAEEKSSGTPVSSSGTSSFSQVIPIPKDADPKAIKAQTKGNALLVIIPKKKTST